MVKVMYHDQLLYKVVSWTFFGISLWTERVALMHYMINYGGINNFLVVVLVSGGRGGEIVLDPYGGC